MSGYGFLKKVLNAFVQIVLPYKLIGKEKVGQGACVIVGNHYRIWDVVHFTRRHGRKGGHVCAALPEKRGKDRHVPRGHAQ